LAGDIIVDDFKVGDGAAGQVNYEGGFSEVVDEVEVVYEAVVEDDAFEEVVDVAIVVDSTGVVDGAAVVVFDDASVIVDGAA